MTHNPLKIVAIEKKTESWVNTKQSLRSETQAKFERLWLQNPDQFNPLRNAAGVQRIARTLHLIQAHLNPKGIKVADLGCGFGSLSRALSLQGAYLDSVDIASNALKKMREFDLTRIELFQDYVPRTTLKDGEYDLVLATELVAFLPEKELRLFFSELARIVKPGGFIVCSTPIDIYSDGALSRFDDVSQIEFKIEGWSLSYHKFWIQLRNVVSAPRRFAKIRGDKGLRSEMLAKRGVWFRLNTGPIFGRFWQLVQYITAPIDLWLKHSQRALLALEGLCKALSPERGVSHAIWIGKRRPLMEETPIDERPVEKKQKRQVWE